MSSGRTSPRTFRCDRPYLCDQPLGSFGRHRTAVIVAELADPEVAPAPQVVAGLNNRLAEADAMEGLADHIEDPVGNGTHAGDRVPGLSPFEIRVLHHLGEASVARSDLPPGTGHSV